MQLVCLLGLQESAHLAYSDSMTVEEGIPVAQVACGRSPVRSGCSQKSATRQHGLAGSKVWGHSRVKGLSLSVPSVDGGCISVMTMTLVLPPCAREKGLSVAA